jgi:sulfur relay (sulfurtransferase) complex TusBCD TusD component (DsrE family)
MKIGFVIMTEFLKYQQIYSLLKLVEAAKVKNHTITGIFFFGTGILNIQKKAHLGKATRNVPQALADLTASKIPMYACQTWADNYGIFPEDTYEGIEIAGLGELASISGESDKMVVFGAHS